MDSFLDNLTERDDRRNLICLQHLKSRRVANESKAQLDSRISTVIWYYQIFEVGMQWSLATIALVPRGGTAHVDRTAWRHTIDWAARSGFEALEISPQWLNL